MPIFDTFSYRKRVAEGGAPDLFVYNLLPEALRNQIVHIWRDAIGPYVHVSGFGVEAPNNNQGWKRIHDVVVREHGLQALGEMGSIFDNCVNYLRESPVDKALDLIEISFVYIDKAARHLQSMRGIRISADDAIEELNERFRRAGVGYQFVSGRLVKVDSELIHSEIVRPVLRFLDEEGFSGSRQEFLEAHARYRDGNTKDAITNANKAFESMLKTICDQKDWPYPKNSRASDLLKVIRDNGLLPDHLGSSFTQLAATLKSGLPEVRNKEGAHGQGATVHETPDYVAAYAIHLAAVKIQFLFQAHKAMT